MHCLKSLVLAGVMGVVAAPAFAGAFQVDAAPTHPHATPMKKKKKSEAEKCDMAGKPCKDGEDCKLENCKPAEPSPAPAPGEGAPN